MNPLSAELVHEHLRPMGYAVDWAPDGKVALEMATRVTYEALLLDVNHPELDAGQVVAQLRMMKPLDAFKVILITAGRPDGGRSQPAQAGIDGYLTKPLNLIGLSAELNRVLAI